MKYEFWGNNKRKRKSFTIGIQIDESIDPKNTLDKFFDNEKPKKKKEKSELAHIVNEWKRKNGY